MLQNPILSVKKNSEGNIRALENLFQLQKYESKITREGKGHHFKFGNLLQEQLDDIDDAEDSDDVRNRQLNMIDSHALVRRCEEAIESAVEIIAAGSIELL